MMIFDDVRKLKSTLLAEIEANQAKLDELDKVESDQVESDATAYFDRMVALLNDLKDAQQFRICFRKPGDTSWTNVLPTDATANDLLGRVAMEMVLERMALRSEKDELPIRVYFRPDNK